MKLLFWYYPLHTRNYCCLIGELSCFAFCLQGQFTRRRDDQAERWRGMMPFRQLIGMKFQQVGKNRQEKSSLSHRHAHWKHTVSRFLRFFLILFEHKPWYHLAVECTGSVYRWMGVGSSKCARRIFERICVAKLPSSYNSIDRTRPNTLMRYRWTEENVLTFRSASYLCSMIFAEVFTFGHGYTEDILFGRRCRRWNVSFDRLNSRRSSTSYDESAWSTISVVVISQYSPSSKISSDT